MMTQQQPKQKPTLEEVREQFKHWRRKRKKGTKIPTQLWSAAVKLSDRYSIPEISKGLVLNSTDLRKRIEHSRSDSLPEPIIQPSFIGFDIEKSDYRSTLSRWSITMVPK